MNRREAHVPRNCDVDWRSMREAGEPARTCTRCSKSVHDLSAMDDASARAVLASGRPCVRFLYDAQGRIVRETPGAMIIPASALLTRRARRRWMAIASLAATTVLLEACGSRGIDFTDAGPDAGAEDASPDVPHVLSDAQVAD